MSGPGLRELKKRRTRASIQEHAVRLFIKQGYDSTTVEQIAAAAEISPATFFRYFKTKEDVVIEDDYDPMMVAALEAAPADLPPLRALRHALTAAFREIPKAERRQIFERTRLIMTVPALRARSLDNIVATIDIMAPPLARRIGGPNAHLAARTLAGAVIGVTLAVVLQWVEAEGKLDLADLMDDALGALETGLA
jgi:AcrR family transcriptional regulator